MKGRAPRVCILVWCEEMAEKEWASMEAAANAIMEPPIPPPPAPVESGYVTSTVSSVLFQFVGIFFLSACAALPKLLN